MDRYSLVKQNAQLIDRLGFNLVSVADTRSCFDIIAERNGVIMLLKVVKNIDSVNESSVESLKKLGLFFNADTFIIGSKHKGQKISDDASLARHGVSCVSESALEYMITSGNSVAKSEKFSGAKYKIDGIALKRLRNLCGMSMRKLAGAVGISKDSIYRYERGEAYATKDSVKRLESFFKNKMAYEEQLTSEISERKGYNYKKLNGSLNVKFFELGSAPFELLGKREYRYEVGQSLDSRTLYKLSILYKDIAELLKNDYPFFITKGGSRRSINGIAVLSKGELQKIANEDQLISAIESRSQIH